MKTKTFIFRAFYYFRIGYSTYLSLPVALLGWITLIYQLTLRNVPALSWLFPRFSIFLVVTIIILLPLAAVVGWIHVKRTGIFKTQIDIDMEANPFNYKLAPGKETILTYPAGLLSLKLAFRFYQKQGILTTHDEKEFQGLIEKYERLLKGETLK